MIRFVAEALADEFSFDERPALRSHSEQAEALGVFQAACAAAESVRPYVTVWGRVSWIRQ